MTPNKNVIFSNQIGKIGKFNCFQVTEGYQDKYILQLLKINPDSCVFMKYWQDDTKPMQGVLRLDTNELFNVEPDIIRLDKIDEIPAWMASLYVDPLDYSDS